MFDRLTPIQKQALVAFVLGVLTVILFVALTR
jgi:hypothetical protein